MGKELKQVQPVSMMSILNNLRKSFGNDAVFSGDDEVLETAEPISTGSYALDNTIGLGGVPRGRITQLAGAEASGKTLMALQVVKKWQQANPNNWGLWIDAEYSFNAEWAKVLGVDTSRLLVKPANLGAEVFNFLCGIPNQKKPEQKDKPGFLDELIALGEDNTCGVIVLDSIAAVEPPVEAMYEVAHQNMAAMARFMPAALRRLVPLVHAANVAFIAINQLRVDPGVMYGCFHEDTPIMMADGSQLTIKKIVEEKLSGPVLSFDGKSIVERKIIGWHNNGKLKENENWLTFEIEGTGGHSGKMGFTCTPDHIIVSNTGKEIPAKEIKVGDNLMSWYESILTDTEKEIIIGSMFGDGHLSAVGNNSASLKLTNSIQEEYVMWKIKSLKSLCFSRTISQGEYGERICFRSNGSFELGLLRDQFYFDNDDEKKYRTIPLNLLAEASKRTLAVWYMDDGHFKETHKNASISVKRLSIEDGIEVARILCKQYVGISYSKSQKSIIIPTEAFIKFSLDISKFVIPVMAYKILPEHRKFTSDLIDTNISTSKRVLYPGKVVSIKHSKRKHRSKNKYDLTIENNSFYLVGGDNRGVVVHNSPETTPGGKAWKHFCRLMINFAKVNAKEELILNADEEPIGHTVRAKIQKNSFAIPRDTKFVVKYLEGVANHNVEMLELGIKYGIIQRPNNRTYVYDSQKWNGREAAEQAFKDEKVFLEIWEKVKLARLNSLVAEAQTATKEILGLNDELDEEK